MPNRWPVFYDLFKETDDAELANRDFQVVTICGSMRYQAEMLDAARKLTVNGLIVLMPFVADYIGGVKADEKKRMLDAMHFAKIDMSDGIIVVGDHIGESTTNEIEYAKLRGKGVVNWQGIMRLLNR